MNKNLIRLAAIAALTVSAQALTVSGVDPFGYVVGGAATGGKDSTLFTGGDITYSIPVTLATIGDFPSGAIITGVSYEIRVGTYATYNILGTHSGYTVQWGIGVNGVVGTDPGGVDPFGNLINFGSFALSPLTVIGGPASGSTAQVVASGGVIPAPGPVANYLTGATVNFNFTADTYSAIGGGATGEQQPKVFQGADVRITYTYRLEEIPEPSTYAAGAVLLAGAGFIARRRMKAA